MGKVCSVFGHRDLNMSQEENKRLDDTFVDLIENQGVDIFYIGAIGDFDDICYQKLTELRETKYPHIKRVYIADDYKYIDRPWKQGYP